MTKSTCFLTAESVSPTPAPVKTTVQMSAHVALRKRSISTAPDTEDLRKRSITSASDTDPYDEIDYNNDKPQIKQKGTQWFSLGVFQFEMAML